MNKAKTLVRDLMTKQVIKATPNQSFTELCRLLLQLDIHHLPVVDEMDNLEGMISSNDILNAFGRKLPTMEKTDEASLNGEVTVYDLMSPNPVIISPEASVEEAVQLFKKHRIQSLPVVAGEALVGILTTRDVINHLAES